jgi:hypothetical protein
MCNTNRGAGPREDARESRVSGMEAEGQARDKF